MLSVMSNDALTAALLYFSHPMSIRQAEVSITTMFAHLVMKPGLSSPDHRWTGQHPVSD